MNSSITVNDLMTKEVISVHPDTDILKAHEVISKNSLDGVPVVDEENKLQGILTEYDLIFRDTFFHLPTFQKLFAEIKVYKKDNPEFQEDINSLKNLRVKDVMNADPFTLPVDSSIDDVLEAFRNHHRVNPIPVIDSEKHVVGVISRFDVLKVLDKLKQ